MLVESTVESRPRINFGFVVFVAAIIFYMLGCYVIDTPDSSVGRDLPQGTMQRGWVVCWNKANHYKGEGRIVWVFSDGKCEEVFYNDNPGD